MGESTPSPVDAPLLLYKYTSTDTARRILESGKLRYSSPLLFNDPFDAQWDPFWTMRTPGMRLLRRQLVLKFLENPDQLPADCEVDFRQAMIADSNRFRTMNPIDATKARDEHIQLLENQICNHPDLERTYVTRVAKLRVCSFSAEKDVVLMWSHYADQHKGVVLVFDSSKLPTSQGGVLAPVEYEERLPEVIDSQATSIAVVSGLPVPPPDNARLRRVALVKAAGWKHEVEWRHVFGVPDGSKGLFSELAIQSNSLVGLVAGMRTSAFELLQLAALTRGINPNARICKMHPREDAFGLEMLRTNL